MKTTILIGAILIGVSLGLTAQISDSTKFKDAQRESSLRSSSKKVFVLTEINTSISFCMIDKNDYLLTDTKYFKKEDGWFSPIEEATSNSGISFGSKVELFLANFFIRGSYSSGKYSFDIGEFIRQDFAADLGIEFKLGKDGLGGFFLGWRKMQEDHSDWSSPNLEEVNVSDGVFGFTLRQTPNKKGFLVYLETAFGFHTFSGYEEVMLVDGSAGFGYRFKSFPLAINIGGVASAYSIPTSEVKEYFNSFYNKTIRTIENQHSACVGASVKVSYCF